MNGMVFALNEVPDGSANSIIDDIARELEKLRDIACALQLKNPEKINWTLFTSSSSDSASTQKRFNRLLEQRRQEDKAKFGPAGSNAIELVQNLCAMHLGCNLRKAFLIGMASTDRDETLTSGHRDRDSVETFIYEFCKLFGTSGVPEYGSGRNFHDYLQLKIGECKPDEKDYYQSCAQTTLERQVGNRYFVSASNATKIIFLAEAAINYLEYTGKSDGNNLERTVYQKLNNVEEMARLKADALMFYFIYSDLVMLAKSAKLNKSAFDMSYHYLELKLFLAMIEDDPLATTYKSYQVFTSEQRLYGSDKDTNHRIRSNNLMIYERLFCADEWDTNILHPLLKAGASSMKTKLTDYAKNQLPGGIYWEPPPAVEAILRDLKPNNDVCESILGLNDYLSTAIPNMHQLTRSNLVEVKKNGTLEWYRNLPLEKRSCVARTAQKRRKLVAQQYSEEEKVRSEKRQENMRKCHRKQEASKAKAAKEKALLAKEHLITTSIELSEVIEDIDSAPISAFKKKQKKLSLLRTQINLRKKILNQKINIVFSKNRKQRPLGQIVSELSTFIDNNPQIGDSLGVPNLSDPFSLIGREINHRFEIESGEQEWFHGIVISYNATTKLYEISYDGETDHQFFDLSSDLLNGDVELF